MFLNAIQYCGVGNWDEISVELGNKSPEECRNHFHEFYFSGVLGRENNLEEDNACVRYNVPYILQTNSLDPPRDNTRNFILQSMSGYRFARSDFDIPFDHSAESTIINVISYDDGAFEQNEEPSEQLKYFIEELSCSMLRAYNHRLKERKRIYCNVRKHGLILQRKILAWLSKYSEVFHHPSVTKKFVAFTQISDPTSFDFLMESLKVFSSTKKYLYR